MVEWRGFDRLLSDAFIIAFGTLVLYGVAFIFWFGFVAFFGIPFMFVDLGLNGIVLGVGLFVGLMLLLLFVTLFLYAILFRWNFVKRLVAWEKRVRERARERAKSMRVTTSEFVELLLFTLVVLFFSASWSYFLGQFVAMTTTEFLVTATASEMVVLYKSGDNLICAPFDRKEKKVYRRFTILRLDKESMPVLSLQKVGPLTPVE